MVAPLLQPSALPITMPSTSPIAHPVRQCSVAAQAVRFRSMKETGGVRGIRTLDTGLSRYNALAGRPLRPLGHHSGGAAILTRRGSFHPGLDGCDERLQRVEVGRLHQVVVEAGLAHAAAILVLAPAGERDQRGVRAAR